MKTEFDIILLSLISPTYPRANLITHFALEIASYVCDLTTRIENYILKALLCTRIA